MISLTQVEEGRGFVLLQEKPGDDLIVLAEGAFSPEQALLIATDVVQALLHTIQTKRDRLETAGRS